MEHYNYCIRAGMTFKPYLNGFVADTTDRRLRVRLGYIKMKNIGQTGLPGYLRSVGMTQRNRREYATRTAVSLARRTAANNDEPVEPVREGPAADRTLAMNGIPVDQLSRQWYSITVDTPGSDMPLALYTVTTNWIDETPHVINSLTVVEIGEDKKGYSAASRRGRGRGRGGRGRGQQRGSGGPSDEHDVPTGWRHMHAMLEINSPQGYATVLNQIFKDMLLPFMPGTSHFCIKEFGYGQTPELNAGYLQKDRFKSDTYQASEQLLCMISTIKIDYIAVPCRNTSRDR